MQIHEHIAMVEREGKRFAAAAGAGDLDTPVPTCPGWDMRELVRHLIEIHLWAAAHLAQPHDKPWVDDLSELAAFWPDLAVFWPDDDQLVEWYLKVHGNLVDALRSAPADVDAFTFLPAPSPLAMWARRQAHEIAVHRFDAEHAIGQPSAFDPTFAADGVDELVAAFAPRRKELPVQSSRAMSVTSTDTSDHWRITMGPDGINTTYDDLPGDVEVTGTAADLYLLLWNRQPDSTVAVTGDIEVLAFWHGNHKVQWS